MFIEELASRVMNTIFLFSQLTQLELKKNIKTFSKIFIKDQKDMFSRRIRYKKLRRTIYMWFSFKISVLNEKRCKNLL